MIYLICGAILKRVVKFNLVKVIADASFATFKRPIQKQQSRTLSARDDCNLANSQVTSIVYLLVMNSIRANMVGIIMQYCSAKHRGTSVTVPVLQCCFMHAIRRLLLQ